MRNYKHVDVLDTRVFFTVSPWAAGRIEKRAICDHELHKSTPQLPGVVQGLESINPAEVLAWYLVCTVQSKFNYSQHQMTTY